MATATVTIEGEEYNVYQDHAAVNSFLRGTIHATGWATALEDAQKKACVTATRMFDRTNWDGTPTVDGQDLSFPRDGLTDRDGVALADDTTPQGILDGFSELCGLLIDEAALQDKANTGSNVKNVKAGSASVTFFNPTQDTAGRFPTSVQEQVVPFLAGNEATGITVTGAGTETEFAATDFGLTREGLP